MEEESGPDVEAQGCKHVCEGACARVCMFST